MLTRFKSKFTPFQKIGPSSSGANNGTFNSFTRLLLCHRLIELSLQSKVRISRFKIWYIGLLNQNFCRCHKFLRGKKKLILAMEINSIVKCSSEIFSQLAGYA